MGDQIRGFGFLHDGTIDTLFRFHSAVVFVTREPGPPDSGDPGNPGGIPLTPEGLAERRALEAFMLVFDSNLKPVVGQQVTLRSSNHGVAVQRLALLAARADRGDCDLTARGIGRHGFLYEPGGKFRMDRAGVPLIDRAAFEFAALFPGVALTFSCVPPGSGRRLALDRDGDGVLDGDEASP